MKRTYWVLIAIGIMIAVIAGGCAGAQPTVPPPSQQAPATETAQPAGTVSASVKLEPVQKSSMAFLITGPVKEVDVKAGDQVKAGQKLIVLDTPDLTYAVVSAQAELKSAQANATLQRMARKVWNPDKLKFISLSGPPELRQIADARVTQAQAALDAAQANLSQGTLVAPYDGTVVSIDPMSTLYNGDTVFKVTVELDHPPMGLMWGMSGDVAIQTK